MGRVDPFYGYSFILRTLLYVVIPAFGVWQAVRLKRALHVFQLESYKRHWFSAWCRKDRRRALFLTEPAGTKKALVMTGRAWRMLVTALVLSIFGILLPSAAAHLIGGAPWDLATFAIMTVLVFLNAPRLLIAADVSMGPVQSLINARFLRAATRRLAEVAPVVVGVTGSFGKTSTKFAIEQLIGSAGEVLATPGSFNTPLGVSRTINESLGPQHRYFIVEMGARQEGDVAEICRLVRPRIAVLTAIGPAHLETFGSLEAVARGKYEIVAGLSEGGTAIFNVDDPAVAALADATSGRTVRYGLEGSGRPDVTARDVQLTERGTSFTVVDDRSGASVDVTTRLLGRHALGHVLAGVSVALEQGRSLADLAPAVEAMSPVEHRLQIIDGAGGVTVIDDAYNSNPAGAAEALEILGRLPGKKKVVITPGMLELGPLQSEANERLGELAAQVADHLIVVAEVNREAIVRGATRAGGQAEVITVGSLAAATTKLAGLIGPGDVVLFENDLPGQYEA
jgi:UDP-N-acetylmuramoyl-tripeptide--D-alanyl-D-alanine ligase